MEFAAHAPAKGVEDQLVLGHAGLARKGTRHDVGRVVVAIAGQVGDRHLGIGQGPPDQMLDIGGVHRHGPNIALRFRSSKTTHGAAVQAAGLAQQGRVVHAQMRLDPEGRVRPVGIIGASRGARRLPPGAVSCSICASANQTGL